MRIEITYFADDDTEFETEEECLEYERIVRDNFSTLVFFDEKMNKIDNPDLTKIESDAYYFYTLEDTKSEDAIDWINQQIGNLETNRPIVKNHFYGYDDDVFVDFTDEFEKLGEKLRILDENLKK